MSDQLVTRVLFRQRPDYDKYDEAVQTAVGAAVTGLERSFAPQTVRVEFIDISPRQLVDGFYETLITITYTVQFNG